jgi:hypothetical protein
MARHEPPGQQVDVAEQEDGLVTRPLNVGRRDSRELLIGYTSPCLGAHGATADQASVSTRHVRAPPGIRPVATTTTSKGPQLRRPTHQVVSL